MSFFNRYIFQIAGALAAAACLILVVFKSSNSTASIGFLFLPVAILIGALAGDSVKYFIDIFRGQRAHSIGKTILILVVVGVCAYKFVQTQMFTRDLKIAGDSSTPTTDLLKLLRRNDSRLTHAIVLNPSLPAAEFEKIFEEHLRDYYIMSKAIRRPDLGSAKMERIGSLERADFSSDTAYNLYQTYVWAHLAKRQDIPEALIHKLAAKQDLEHFLILALLDSPYASCEEKLRFLPQTNEVLENAIHRSMAAQNCTQ